MRRRQLSWCSRCRPAHPVRRRAGRGSRTSTVGLSRGPSASSVLAPASSAAHVTAAACTSPTASSTTPTGEKCRRQVLRLPLARREFRRRSSRQQRDSGCALSLLQAGGDGGGGEGGGGVGAGGRIPLCLDKAACCPHLLETTLLGLAYL